MNKIIQGADWPSRLAFCFFWNIKSLYFTHSLSYWFVLSLALIRCYSLSFIAIRCTCLPLVVTRCFTHCHSSYTRCHWLPLFVIPRTTCCQSLSLVVIHKRSLFHIFLLVTSFIIKNKKQKKKNTYLSFKVITNSKLNSSIVFSLAIFWGRGPTRWAPRVEEHKHPVTWINLWLMKLKSINFDWIVNNLIV